MDCLTAVILPKGMKEDVDIKKYISEVFKNIDYTIGGDKYNNYIKIGDEDITKLKDYDTSKEDGTVLDDNMILAKDLFLLVESGRVDKVAIVIPPKGKILSYIEQNDMFYPEPHSKFRDRFIKLLNGCIDNFVVGVQIEFDEVRK